jgi:hypothetical protein
MDARLHQVTQGIQRAVMSAPSTSLNHAVETARQHRRSLAERLATFFGGDKAQTAAGASA